jgi:hypothetical protein
MLVELHTSSPDLVAAPLCRTWEEDVRRPHCREREKEREREAG